MGGGGGVAAWLSGTEAGVGYPVGSSAVAQNNVKKNSEQGDYTVHFSSKVCIVYNYLP